MTRPATSCCSRSSRRSTRTRRCSPGSRTLSAQALGDAAAATGPRSATRLELLENGDAAALCGQGIRFATATQAELNALVAAEKPVYDSLAADPSSAQVIEQIDALKQEAVYEGAAPDFAASSLIRLLMTPHGTSSGLPTHWIRRLCSLAS
jgi:hypothetical protein